MGDADARAAIWAPLCMLVAACAWAVPVAGVQGRDARPQVVVRLQDAAGRPWSSAGVEVQAEGLWERLPSTWPSKPRVMLFPCSADDRIAGAPRVGRVESPSRIVFEVEEGARYLAGAYGAGFDGALRAVGVPPGSGAVPIDLASAELWLERPGRRPECVVVLELAEKGSDSEGQHQIRDWPLGAAHRSEILPSGSAVLVARLPAGRERRIELDLRAGTTTPVTLEF